MRCLTLVTLLVLAGCKDPPRPTGTSGSAGSATGSRAAGPAARTAHLEGLVRATVPAPARSARAEAARRDAERVATPAAWDRAAERYEELLRGCGDLTATCHEAAYSAVLARQKALQLEALAPPPDELKPVALPARVEAVVAATDEYARRVDASDPELPGMRFIAASAYSRYGWDEDALPRFEEIVRSHREHAVSEYAANLLLDALNRAGKYDELRRWAAIFLADEQLLAGKPELRATLERILTQPPH